MQGLQLGQFGRFVFLMEYNGSINPYDIEGAEIADMDHHRVWIEGMAGDVFNVMKKDIKLFEPMRRKLT